MRRAPARPVRACFVRSCCSVAVQEHDLRATPVQCKHFPHTSHCTLHTPHSTLALHLNSSHLSSSHLIPCLPICQLSSSWPFSCQVLPSTDVYYKSLQKPLPSTTSYYKACTKHVPVLLCTAQLAQSTSHYYFVLQSLHKALPSTTVYYKACPKHFPVLLWTTKLAQNTFQYFFVLQELHKLLPSTLYYKGCTKHFPVLLCTAQLAQSTSQYYFVLQSLHKTLPSTLYYKACTKHVPVLLCTTKLAQTTWNPAHRRPWLKMRIEYHPALIFYAFGRGFLKSQVCSHSVAEFHWEVSKMVFSPQGNGNFHAFLK